MKPVFGIIAVLAFLLAMIPGIGCADSPASVEPVDETGVSDEIDIASDLETAAEVEVSAEPEVIEEPEVPDEIADADSAEAPAGVATPEESESPGEPEPAVEPETPAEPESDLVPATELEQAYLKSVIDYVSAIGDSVNVVGTLFSDPQNDDEEWQATVYAYIAQIEGAPDAFEEVDPPPALEDFSDAALSLLEHCSTFAELIGEAIEDGETEVPEDARQELVKADASLADMGTALNAFLAVHPMYSE